MSLFCCPVCRGALREEGQALRCVNGHSFDRAKQGYVNLLRSQASSAKRHGDDREMISARTRFLSAGFYTPLQEAVARLAADHAPSPCQFLDAGCGEGYYTEAVFSALLQAGKEPQAALVDISKDAVKAAAKRPFPHECAVGSVFSLPACDAQFHLVLNLFSPCAAEEFHRVLLPGGLLLRVVPLRWHLFGLKAAVYDTPYENPETEEMSALPGFRLLKREELKWDLHLSDPGMIDALFKMTPYYYKTSAKDQAKLASLTHLDTEVAFGLLLEQKEL